MGRYLATADMVQEKLTSHALISVQQNQASTQWVTLLDNHIPALFEDGTPFVRAGACDCLSSIGNAVIDSLPVAILLHLYTILTTNQTPKKYFCITLLLGLTKDGTPAVKAAAIRSVLSRLTHVCSLD